MGLDTFASRSPDRVEVTEDDERAFETVGELCGGMFSGDGGSFRGKVYLDVVERVTGENLGQEWIPPDTVRRMWLALDRSDPEEVARASADDRYPATAGEVQALARFLRVCAERGLGLIGWW